MSKNVILTKSFAFALRIIDTYKYLTEDKREFVLSKQLLRSGTSIGANVEESSGAQSRNDFFAKMTISYKECRETHYWLRLLKEAKYLENDRSDSLLIECEELLKIITQIQKTMKINSTKTIST